MLKLLTVGYIMSFSHTSNFASLLINAFASYHSKYKAFRQLTSVYLQIQHFAGGMIPLKIYPSKYIYIYIYLNAFYSITLIGIALI